MSAPTGFRSRGWQAGLTLGLLIAGIVLVVGLATRTVGGRAGAAVAEQQLRRVPALAALVMKARATEAAPFDDSTARDIAAATGTDVVLLDTATGSEPRILGSSVPRGAALAATLRQLMTANAQSPPAVVRSDIGGEGVYVESHPLPGRDGRIAVRLVAMVPAAASWFGGPMIVAAAALAGLVALLVGVLAEQRLNRRSALEIEEMTAAARDAAHRQAALSEDDLAEVATTRLHPVPRPMDGGAIDGSRLSPGYLFADRYEIIELLGRSDVRTAYKARDRELSELILLKTLRDGAFAGDSGSVAQFKADLRVVRRLAHRNILRTYDFGECSVYYVTMELVDATPVHDLLELQGRLSVSLTMAIASQASRALAVAHREGVLHRDIRPQSLLLDSRGLLKVADFGLATTAQRTRALAHIASSADVVAYVPPELLRGGAVDARSDLYSLAVVLYQCLAGRLPGLVTDGTVGEGTWSDSIEPLSSIDPTVPQAFSDLISQTLSSRPELRPADAGAFRQMLAFEATATQ